MIEIRQARTGDAGSIGRIEMETWRATYPGMLRDHVLIGMSAESLAAEWAWRIRHRAGDVVVAEDQPGENDEQGRLLGFGHCGEQRDPRLPYTGEVTMLYVLPDAQGQGIGRDILLALFQRLVRRGLTSALIWVVRANPSRFFYERLGGRLVLHRRIPVGGQAVEALGYAWPDLPAALAPGGIIAGRHHRGR